jgi:hypothetical protein
MTAESFPQSGRNRGKGDGTEIMRVTENRPLGEVRKAGRAQRTSSSGVVFSLADEASHEEARSVASAGSYVPVADISVLLAMQTFDNERQQRQQEIRQGHAMLDALDELKVGMLSGRVSAQSLTQIASLAYRERNEIGEPGLAKVLSHIELRARVELAKLEKSRR